MLLGEYFPQRALLDDGGQPVFERLVSLLSCGERITRYLATFEQKLALCQTTRHLHLGALPVAAFHQ